MAGTLRRTSMRAAPAHAGLVARHGSDGECRRSPIATIACLEQDARMAFGQDRIRRGSAVSAGSSSISFQKEVRVTIVDLEPLTTSMRTSCVHGDIVDYNLLEVAVQQYRGASGGHPQPAHASAATTFHANVQGAGRAAGRRGRRVSAVIVASSDTVFGLPDTRRTGRRDISRSTRSTRCGRPSSTP